MRKGQFEPCAISFAKRGNNVLFAIAYEYEKKARIVSPEEILCLFKAEPDEKSYEYDQNTDMKFTIIRNEIKKPYPKINIDRRKAQAIDNLEKLRFVYNAEKDYISDLLEVINSYDDLSDGELKYLANISVRADNARILVEEIKEKIPVHYIIQIKQKVESIDSQTEIIMFTEDIRYDNN